MDVFVSGRTDSEPDDPAEKICSLLSAELCCRLCIRQDDRRARAVDRDAADSTVVQSAVLCFKLPDPVLRDCAFQPLQDADRPDRPVPARVVCHYQTALF